MPKLAFLIQTHNQEAHVERLCHALADYPEAAFFCHHDFSKGEAHPALQRVASFVTPHRVTAWGRTPVVLAEFDLFDLALRESDAEWFVLLSANCYPIKSASYINTFLKETRFNGFMDSNLARKGNDLPGWWWSKTFTRPFCRIPFLSRKLKFYLRTLRVRRNGVPFSPGLPLRFGANWIILRRSIVELLMQMNPWEHPATRFYQELENREGRHMSPEEAIVQTMLGDPAVHDISSDYLRFIDWENAVDWHPNLLTERHWEKIQQSPALFARKFNAETSRALLDRIDNEILFREPHA